MPVVEAAAQGCLVPETELESAVKVDRILDRDHGNIKAGIINIPAPPPLIPDSTPEKTPIKPINI